METRNSCLPPHHGKSLTIVAVILLGFGGCAYLHFNYRENIYERYLSGGHYLGVNPSMSPDGESLYFSTPRSGDGDIYAANLNTGKQTRLTDSETYDGMLALSPDGKKIAYVKDIRRVSHIWVMDSDGKNKRQLTFGDRTDSEPSFSPDGKTIIFDRAHRDFVSEIWTVRVDGSNLTQVNKGEAVGNPVFARNGRDYFGDTPYGNDEREIRKISGGEQIWSCKGYLPSVSRNGSKLAYLLEGDGYVRTIMLLDFKTGKTRSIGPTQLTMDRVHFNERDTGLVYLDARGDRGIGNINHISFDGKITTLLRADELLSSPGSRK